MTLVSVGNAVVAFGATEIFRDVTFTVAAGDRWAVIGRNGTGKTSLMRLITGDLAPVRGSVARSPGLRIALMDQHRRFPESETLWDIVAGAFGELRDLEHSLAEQARQLEHDHSDAAMDRYGRDLERFEREGGYAMSARVDSVLTGMGFDAAAARVTAIGTLSGGERGRVALARQLAMPSELLILDEPTNHLDLATTAWLEQYLQNSDRTVVCISHDRAFLAAIADHVLHFEGGTAFSYTGGYESFIRQREEQRLTQQRQFDQQQKKIASEQDYIARNLAGQNSAQAKGRRKRLERMPRLSPPPGAESVMALRLEAGERSGDRVVEAIGVTVAAGERELLRDVSIVLERGEVVALVGPNGIGKSTLIRTLIGEVAPRAGEVRIGPSTTVAYYRQDLAHLALDQTIYDAIAELRPRWERRLVQGHLGRFGFSGDEAQRVIGSLSGGERSRVALALLTLERSNLLILDEPTNHLDVESIEALEDAIEEYQGTVLIVSHDRAVLRGVAMQVWELKGGQLLPFSGTFIEWEEAKAEREARSRAALEEQRNSERVRTNRAVTPKGGRKPDAADKKKELKRLENALADAEQRVSSLEATVAALEHALDDTSLYDTPAGIEKAQRLGRELDDARNTLEEAIGGWGLAVEQLEAARGAR